MTDTQAFVYAIRPTGATGALLAVGTLVLPYFVVFHPQPGAPGEPDDLTPVRDALGAAGPGELAVRVLLRSRTATTTVSQTIDGSVYFGGTDDDGGGWVAGALLDEPSTAVYATLPPAVDPTGADVPAIFRHFVAHPRLLADAAGVKAPGAPKKVAGVTRRSGAKKLGVTFGTTRWTPPVDGGVDWAPVIRTNWPDWLPLPLDLDDLRCLRTLCEYVCIWMLCKKC